MSYNPSRGCKTLRAEDVAVIALPSYGGRVPCTAVDRLVQVRANGARAVLESYAQRLKADTDAWREKVINTSY